MHTVHSMPPELEEAFREFGTVLRNALPGTIVPVPLELTRMWNDWIDPFILPELERMRQERFKQFADTLALRPRLNFSKDQS